MRGPDPLFPVRIAEKVQHGPAIFDGLFFACIAVLAGTLDAGLLLGWDQLNPTNLAWLRKDPAIYQAGWEFLRRQPWTLPLMWVGHLDYPFGISAAYLDVIPAIALPLRLVTNLLPENFQYLGAYAAFCLVLQLFFGLKLLSCFTSDRVLTILGALFFLNSPILLIRLFGHFSLCSQWLILAALYYYFRPVERIDLLRYVSPFAWLTALSGAITPYLAVMVLAIGIAALFRSHLETVRLSPDRSLASSSVANGRQLNAAGGSGWIRRQIHRSGVLWIGLLIASTVLSLLIFGFLTLGAAPQLEAAGYGSFSMNLLSPLNPSGPSLYFKSFNVLPAQMYEGYEYLGMGVMLLGVVCLSRDPGLARKFLSPAVRPLLYMSLLLTFVALSVRITFGQTVLVTVGVPATIFHVLAVFRSSGRFFWPVYYLLILGSIVGVVSAIPSRWSARAVVAGAFLLQFFDTLPIRDAIAEQSRTTVSNPLVAPDWTIIGAFHRHLIVLPAWQCDSTQTPGGEATWPWFARLAAKSGLTLNGVHAARSSTSSIAFNCTFLPKTVSNGELDSSAAYVLSDRLARQVIARNATHYCRRIDGFNLCTFDLARAGLSWSLAKAIPRRN